LDSNQINQKLLQTFYNIFTRVYWSNYCAKRKWKPTFFDILYSYWKDFNEWASFARFQVFWAIEVFFEPLVQWFELFLELGKH
jgi:hypothetical protein